ncbi:MULTISPECIES: arginyltransferase [Aliivibrio]|jgi:arginine-tRNA-protein transferase|uniref:Aspartate/glutamate leucyltransferase n=3 Tax=Aliivibrio TaxID=511678 RepID=A0A1B9P1W2_ALILO|nr:MULTISPECIES: arginyltransferase [Aliivibrio]AZL85368.1 arginyltransferase [Aliivibrio salmonicida]MBB1314254.1 arginyltransferase [Aliivibrio sp. SR45-2]OCH22349.1 arginyltransferase [Aliivibrio logei]OEF13559.1 arginyltransferase [Aliivibrio logei 5S-186]CAQ79901.1 putative arginine-tRNA-protein transferase [Aliivibrio salmonicida LFI1238]
MTQYSLQVGLTPEGTCSYLPDQKDRLGVIMEPELHSLSGYQELIRLGFRRSGSTIYKPMCDSCNACQPLRIDAENFSPSKSQKRILNKSSHFEWEIKSQMDENWFSLYERYINARHQSGSMFPANKEQFFEFAQAEWLPRHFLHIYENEVLVSIAVTDLLSDSLSAMYTFFDPDNALSLGTVSVLIQLQLCTKLNKKWVYPGYQIDDCPAMKYKDRYKPNQKLVNMVWQG